MNSALRLGALLVAFFNLITLASTHIVKRQTTVPFGQVITKCTKPGVFALTFDDGPAANTFQVLDRLKAAGHRATFFVNGNNYGYIYNYNSTIRRMIADGHQLGSHTWSHPQLPTLSNDGIKAEMTQLEDAFVNILGYFPYYFRAPYFNYGSNVLPVMSQMQYHVIGADVDTLDWQYKTADTIGTAKQRFTDGVAAGGSISLSHDPQPLTGTQLVDHMISVLNARGMKSVPVGECLNDPAANWYRPARGATNPPSPTTTTTTSPGTQPTGNTSPDGSCGGTTGFVCPTGQCCSKYGKCGTTDAFCIGQNCQPAYGLCKANLPSGSVSPDGTCGGTIGYVCPSGKCCSKSNWCGTTDAYCGSGCQLAYGICSGSPPAGTPTTTTTATTPTTTTANPPASTATISPDGTCGGTTKYTCPSGQCCSKYNKCGSTDAHCIGQNCQPAFGMCKANLPAGSTSPDGTCGGTVGYKCPDGKCCSKSFWCGTTTAYCGTGCQPAFGTCSA